MYNNNPYNNSMAQGGLYNALSGAGGISDKATKFEYFATLFNNSSKLEILYNESWACKRFVNLPIEQMFIKPRIISSNNDELVPKYNKYLSKFKVNKKLSNAMKSARLNGTAFLIFMTKDAPLTEPLNLKDLGAGDLTNITVFNRWQVNVTHRESNPYNSNYGLPVMYNITPRNGGSFTVHHSRVLRFDGQDPLTDDGWTTYNVDFGVSEIIPVLQSIYNEEGTAHAITHLTEEASTTVLKMQDFEDMNPNGNGGNQDQLDIYAQNLNRNKSVYGMTVISATDDMSRLEVSLAGMAQVLNSQTARLASASGISEMIFLGKSPTGFNSSGNGELESNAQMVAAKQELELRPAYDFIDEICMRTSGLQFDFEYTFPSLTTLSEIDKATVLNTTATALGTLSNAGFITTDEGREQLSRDELFQDLKPMQDDFAQAIKKQQAQKQLEANQTNGDNTNVESSKADQEAGE